MNTNICPLCNQPIPADAPGGFCPACVLRDAAESAPAGRAGPSVEEVAAAFPQLEVLDFIGQGGMGFVYKVRQANLDRTVALKILSPELGRDPAFAERFAREARVLGKLSHPNIVTVFEHGESGGFFYLLMEFVDGVNLRQAMRAGRFTPEQALAVVPGICDALQAAHAMGVWHRDIKPENILLGAQGGVKIADFGIARIVGDSGRNFTLTTTGAALGSAAYMAPEQHEKPHDVDHRADIYSLGVVIYEMLTGELPLGRFPAPSQRAAVSARIDEIVLQTLEKERELRQQSAAEVKTDVTRASREAGASTSSTVRHRPPATLTQWSLGLLLAGAAMAGASQISAFGATREVFFTFAIVVLVMGFVAACVALTQMRHGQIETGWRRALRIIVWFPMVALAIFVFFTPIVFLLRSRQDAQQSAQIAEPAEEQARRDEAESYVGAARGTSWGPGGASANVVAPSNSPPSAVNPSKTSDSERMPTFSKRIVVPGDIAVRVGLFGSVKGGKREAIGDQLVFKTAVDRATGFELRWRFPFQIPDGAKGRIKVELADPDTGLVFYRTSHEIESGTRLNSPDTASQPTTLTNPGESTMIRMVRVEAAKDGLVTDWSELFFYVEFIKPSNHEAVPEFQLPQLPSSATPESATPPTVDGH